MITTTDYFDSDLRDGECKSCGDHTRVLIGDGRCPDCIEEDKFFDMTMGNTGRRRSDDEDDNKTDEEE